MNLCCARKAKTGGGESLSFVKHTIALVFDMTLHLIVIKDFLHHYKWLQLKPPFQHQNYVSLHIKYESLLYEL